MAKSGTKKILYFYFTQVTISIRFLKTDSIDQSSNHQRFLLLESQVSSLVHCIKEKPTARRKLCEKDGGLAFWRCHQIVAKRFGSNFFTFGRWKIRDAAIVFRMMTIIIDHPACFFKHVFFSYPNCQNVEVASPTVRSVRLNLVTIESSRRHAAYPPDRIRGAGVSSESMIIFQQNPFKPAQIQKAHSSQQKDLGPL